MNIAEEYLGCLGFVCWDLGTTFKKLFPDEPRVYRSGRYFSPMAAPHLRAALERALSFHGKFALEKVHPNTVRRRLSRCEAPVACLWTLCILRFMVEARYILKKAFNYPSQYVGSERKLYTCLQEHVAFLKRDARTQGLFTTSLVKHMRFWSGIVSDVAARFEDQLAAADAASVLSASVPRMKRTRRGGRGGATRGVQRHEKKLD